jgi:cellobiose-specific phosphotransferase system component IIB
MGKSATVGSFNGEGAMIQVIVVCAAGASSTFLARRLTVLSSEAGFDWDVTPASVETIVARPDQVVAVSHHVATDTLCESLSERGIRFVVLADGVTGGFGAENALQTISQFLESGRGETDLTAAFASSQEQQS